MSNNKKSRIRKTLDFFQLSKATGQINDSEHPHRRRFLPIYQNRLRYIRDYWLYYLSFILLFQMTAPFIAASFLFSTFLSFAFLDETPFPQTDDEQY